MTKIFRCKYCGGNHESRSCTRDLEGRIATVTMRPAPKVQSHSFVYCPHCTLEFKHDGLNKHLAMMHKDKYQKWDFCIYCKRYVEAGMLEIHWTLVHVENVEPPVYSALL